MVMELDPEQLFVEDENIPEFDEDGIGHQGKPEAKVEDGDPPKKEEPEDGDGDDDDESDEGAGDDGDGDDDPADDDDPSDDDPADGDDEPDGDVFEIDGKEYTVESLTKHLSELESGSLRQSDYTQKTQKLAEMRKGVEADIAFVKAVKDADLMDSIAEALEEAGVKDAKKLVDMALKSEPGEHPDTLELAELRGRLQKIEDEKEAEAALAKEVQELADRKEIELSEAQKVRQFAEERYEQTGTVLTLDDAYDLYLVRNGKLKVKRKQPAVPNTPKAKKGGKPVGGEEKWERMSDQHLFID